MANCKTTSLPFFIAPASNPRDEFGAGYDGNGFATRADAESAIPGLRALGAEWDIDWVVSERRART